MLPFIAYIGTQIDAPLVGGQDPVSSKNLEVMWAGSTLAMAQQFQDGEVRKLKVHLVNPLVLDDEARREQFGNLGHAAIVRQVGAQVAVGETHWDGVVFLDTVDGMEVADVVAVFPKGGSVDHAVEVIGFTRFHEESDSWRSTPDFLVGAKGEGGPSSKLGLPEPTPPDVRVDKELLAAGRSATKTAPPRIESDIECDQQGVVVNALTAINNSLKYKNYTMDDMASHWGEVRALLRERHGDTVTLYRADAPQKNWHAETQVVYMGNQKLATAFATRGRQVEAFAVPVDDILALNVQPNGYWEFVVKKQPASLGLAVGLMAHRAVQAANFLDAEPKSAKAIAP